MIDQAHVRRLALALPETADDSKPGQLAFSVGGKGFAWSFMERTAPKKPRVPRLDILAVRCEIERKEMLIETAPQTYFDDDHYRGFPAVLVRLTAIEADELAALLDRGRLLVAAKPPGRKSRP